uniref:DUF4220 domain-containing protein n=1 Tax=Leersia perrieri TaxID=77586 RepID=A0A0D9XU79_9ORYZ
MVEAVRLRRTAAAAADGWLAGGEGRCGGIGGCGRWMTQGEEAYWRDQTSSGLASDQQGNRWLNYVIVKLPAKNGERNIFTRQHVFLQPFNSRMSEWKLNSCILERYGNASKVRSEGKTAKNVEAAVIQALRSMDLEGNALSRDLPLPRVSDRAEHYWLAYLAEVPSCSRVILVWHIATSLCEIKLAKDHSVNLTAKSRLSSSLVDKRTLTDELQKAYTVSNCLSRYCLYLLVSKPKLLPETILMSKKAFQDAVQCAREMLKGCGSVQSIYEKLMEGEQEALATAPGANVLQQGAILANALINNEDQTCCWEILSEVWAHLIVHIAPSSDAAAHAEDLKSDHEFITDIWALFCHCGIEKSELWQQKKGADSGNFTPEPANQSSNVADTHVQEAVASNPPAARSREIHEASLLLACSKILREGAMLGKKLIDDQSIDEGTRWKILLKVWARLLLHLSSNAQAHAKYLDSGSKSIEFITVLRALFSHCGIDKSELWHNDAAPSSRQAGDLEDSGDIQQEAQSRLRRTAAVAVAEADASGLPVAFPHLLGCSLRSPAGMCGGSEWRRLL